MLRRPVALLVAAASTIPLVLTSAHGEPGSAPAPAPGATIRTELHHDRLPSLLAVPVPRLGTGALGQASPGAATAPGAGGPDASAPQDASAAPPLSAARTAARRARSADAPAGTPAPAANGFTADPPTLPTRNYEGPTSFEAETTAALLSNSADASSAAGATHVLTFAGGTVSALTKSTGAPAYGPAPANALWSGFGGPCQSSVLSTGRTVFDERADRFLAVAPTDPVPPAAATLCVAVSTTGSATGAWSRYSFALPAGTALDNVSIASWTDSFIVSAHRLAVNAEDDPAGPDESAGAERPYLAALERSPMLAGTTARIAEINTATTDAALRRLVPVDLDTPAATGDEGALLAALPENAASASLRFFRLATNWAAPSASFATGGTVPIAAADVAGTQEICPFNCFDVNLGLSPASSYRATGPSAGRVTLGLTERLTASDPGIRYLVVTTAGGSPSLAATGSLSPTADFIKRYQPVVTQDAAGDLVVAYSATDAFTAPGIRASGRAAADPAGQLRPEVDLTFEMAAEPGSPAPEAVTAVVDPADGCTAWVAGGYTPSAAPLGWSTRVASLPFAGCPSSPTGTPRATFSVTPQTGLPPLNVAVNVTSAPGGSPTYAWSFGDGGTATGTPANHTYASAGVYRVTLDAGDGASHATMSRFVAVGATSPPVAANDEISLKPGQTGFVEVIKAATGQRNDYDPDGGTVQLISNTPPSRGTVSCNALGGCSYTPNAGYTGPDKFTYTIRDDELDTATALVRVDVVDRAPFADDDGLVTGQNSRAEIDVLENDLDVDPGDVPTLVSNTNPAHGSVTCTGGGVCTYTPSSGYIGSDRFDYTITDGQLQSSSFVDILVTECPDLTRALTPAGTLVTGYEWVACPSPEADATTALAASGMANDGELAILTTGLAADAAPPNDRPDTTGSFGSAVRGAGDVSILQVNLNVPAGADCLAFDAVFASEEYPEYVGSPFNDAFIAELDTNNWSVSGQVITAPNNFALDATGKVLSVNSALFGSVITANGTEYDGATPPLRIQTPITPGAHSLYLSIFDASDTILDSAAFIDNLAAGTAGAGGCAPGTNQSPRIVADSATTREDRAATIAVLANDTDPDGTIDASSLQVTGAAAHGTAVVQGGAVLYTPARNYFGPDSFTYRACDNQGACATAPVSVTVTPEADGVDYDGDGATDIAVYRPSSGQWFVRGLTPITWGGGSDVPLPGDYNGDGSADYAVYRPSSGQWFVRNGATTTWGGAGDVPVPGDYDGNGSTDIAVYRPSTGEWFVSGGAVTTWGAGDDVPIPADYDGNGSTDVAVYRPSTGQWFVRAISTTVWGLSTDVPLPGDYDANGSADIAVYRPSTGQWFVRDITTAVWGAGGDMPLPGDYDGNGTADIAVYRPSTGQWFVRNGSTTVWGASGDVPLPLPYAIRRAYF
ncbi:MAG: Ig-like domain-containing protein [Acidimicrobiales bacterium]